MVPTTWTISSHACSDPSGGVKTNFDAPTGWDGTCDTSKSLPAKQMCGAEPCVRSITVSPPVIEEQPCTPHLVVEDEPVAKAWNARPTPPVFRVCYAGFPASECVDKPGKLCAPTPPSQATCVWHLGDVTCPNGYDERTVIYKNYDDSRECGECTCGAPSGGYCRASVSAWGGANGGSCSAPEFQQYTETTFPSKCFDLVLGAALTGKTADVVQYDKGSCTPTMDVKGKLSLEGAATVCCAKPVE